MEEANVVFLKNNDLLNIIQNVTLRLNILDF